MLTAQLAESTASDIAWICSVVGDGYLDSEADLTFAPLQRGFKRLLVRN